MTMTYCRACGNDVYITHKDDDCPAGEADLRVPEGLRGPIERDPEPERGEGGG